MKLIGLVSRDRVRVSRDFQKDARRRSVEDSELRICSARGPVKSRRLADRLPARPPDRPTDLPTVPC